MPDSSNKDQPKQPETGEPAKETKANFLPTNPYKDSTK